MFALTDKPIAVSAWRASLENANAGALVTFEGVVRGSSQGRQVVALLYEVYESLATSEGQAILTEAKEKFAILDCLCSHRTGLLKAGDLAVFVAVTAAHRDAAFQACRYIIDEVKERVPIWKQETLSDGESAWVNCDHAQPKLTGMAQSPGKSRAPAEPATLDFSVRQEKTGSFELDILELGSSQLAAYQVVDIREPAEDRANLLKSLLRVPVLQMPLSTISLNDPPLDKSSAYLFVCQHGQRSIRLVSALRARGFSNVWSLAGGVEAVRRKFIA